MKRNLLAVLVTACGALGAVQTFGGALRKARTVIWGP